MAVDVFGNGMHNDIGTVIQRVLDVRTQERVVDHDHDPVPVRHRGNIPDVDQTQCRIAGRFDPDQFGLVRSDHVRDIQLDTRGERDLHAMRRGHLCEIPMCASVDI